MLKIILYVISIILCFGGTGYYHKIIYSKSVYIVPDIQIAICKGQLFCGRVCMIVVNLVPD